LRGRASLGKRTAFGYVRGEAVGNLLAEWTGSLICSFPAVYIIIYSYRSVKMNPDTRWISKALLIA
jgi:hypothetical protein